MVDGDERGLGDSQSVDAENPFRPNNDGPGAQVENSTASYVSCIGHLQGHASHRRELVVVNDAGRPAQLVVPPGRLALRREITEMIEFGLDPLPPLAASLTHQHERAERGIVEDKIDQVGEGKVVDYCRSESNSEAREREA